jgi:uncharacterized protein YgiM (DUF1202 family)
MNKVARFVSTSAVALMLAAAVGISSPAHAATMDKIVTIAQADYVPVLATVTSTTSLYWGPDVGDEIQTDDELHAGDSWYINGQDSTGKWVQVYITDSFSAWVPMSAFASLNGVPLPVVG